MSNLNLSQHYVGGAWVTPLGSERLQVINPATERSVGAVTLGNAGDVDRAVGAARVAFGEYGSSPLAQRVELLRSILAVYEKRQQDIALAITEEMGAPLVTLSQTAQAATGWGHFATAMEEVQHFPFEDQLRGERIVREPIGVCALITPWNWPINQIACKVAPALAVGCTLVLKPSEIAPLSAHVLAEVLDEAGVPAGVFNLVDGAGAGAGSELVSHPDVDMVSFTGSTRAGRQISQAAAQTIKRVCLELGGKSPNLLLEDCDFEAAVRAGVARMMRNTGQTCSAPSRMLVPAGRLAEVERIARTACDAVVVGDPLDDSTTVGPLASREQYDKVQRYIELGLEEGARLVSGGPGLPEGIERGYFAQPTVFSDVDNAMTIAREEIFGPVLCILPYQNEEQAVDIANDTRYGLAAYVNSADAARAQALARRLRAGTVTINGATAGFSSPFGGYKQSGNGREWGLHGMHEYVEVKAIIG